MPSRPNGHIRRAQLVTPFGVGAMVTNPGGTGLVSAGLDHWYERSNEDYQVDPSEFKLREWRLEQLLRVDHFRLPPDWRDPRNSTQRTNVDLTVPFLRFPLWHFCPVCKALEKKTLTDRGENGKVRCRDCRLKNKNKKSYMFQVPFVAICENGHLQDFPWREWAHRTAHPTCNDTLRLHATGSASLAGQKVVCDCGQAERNLSGITQAFPDGTTFVSKNLEEGTIFLCQGKRPWLGTDDGVDCSFQLRGSLRNASNVYFAQPRTSIYLPRSTDLVPSELVEILSEPDVSTQISAAQELGNPTLEQLVPYLRRYSKDKPRGEQLKAFSDEQICAALEIVLAVGEQDGGEVNQIGSDRDPSFRYAEYEALKMVRSDPTLTIKDPGIQSYQQEITSKGKLCDYFSRVTLVERLRETKALVGFTRVYGENAQTRHDWRSLMWREPPQGQDDWLPASVVYGEGIFLELDGGLLQAWENNQNVQERVRALAERFQDVQQIRHLSDRQLPPRFLLLHTLAHLIINRLTFECGYSSASLRERLYVSADPDVSMSGILIYTAAGDAEGTMGGLVRMGKPGYLEPAIRRALESAQWCSADPICMETGNAGGQGPDACNLAACHNCALVPETACEEFNRFLDRWVVVGDHNNPQAGYFSS